MSSHWLIWLPSQFGKNDPRNKLQKKEILTITTWESGRSRQHSWGLPFPRSSSSNDHRSAEKSFFMSKNCCWAAPIVKTLDRKENESGRSIRSILFQKLGRLRRPKCPIICHSYRHSLTVIRIANANTVVWKMKTCDHCGNKFQTR